MNESQTASLKIFRIPNFYGGARSYSIYIDGEKIDNGETVEMPISPGRHKVVISLDLRKSNEMIIDIEVGQTKRLHISHEKLTGKKLRVTRAICIALIIMGAVFRIGGLTVGGIAGLMFSQSGKIRLF